MLLRMALGDRDADTDKETVISILNATTCCEAPPSTGSGRPSQIHLWSRRHAETARWDRPAPRDG